MIDSVDGLSHKLSKLQLADSSTTRPWRLLRYMSRGVKCGEARQCDSHAATGHLRFLRNSQPLSSNHVG